VKNDAPYPASACVEGRQAAPKDLLAQGAVSRVAVGDLVAFSMARCPHEEPLASRLLMHRIQLSLSRPPGLDRRPPGRGMGYTHRAETHHRRYGRPIRPRLP
jgi:hypothetical protein